MLGTVLNIYTQYLVSCQGSLMEQLLSLLSCYRAGNWGSKTLENPLQVAGLVKCEAESSQGSMPSEFFFKTCADPHSHVCWKWNWEKTQHPTKSTSCYPISAGLTEWLLDWCLWQRACLPNSEQKLQNKSGTLLPCALLRMQVVN